MSAHILTVLSELKEKQTDQNFLKYFLQGLSFARFGDLLDVNEWDAFHKIIANGDAKKLNALINILISRYTKIWELLDKPITAESWYKKLYGEQTSSGRWSKKYLNRLKREGLFYLSDEIRDFCWQC